MKPLTMRAVWEHTPALEALAMIPLSPRSTMLRVARALTEFRQAFRELDAVRRTLLLAHTHGGELDQVAFFTEWDDMLDDTPWEPPALQFTEQELPDALEPRIAASLIELGMLSETTSSG